jgi:hypothetical protein
MTPQKPKEIPHGPAKVETSGPVTCKEPQNRCSQEVGPANPPQSKKVGGRRQPAVTRQQQPSRKEQPGRASKQAQVIAMLQAPHGATIEAMAEATGWQPHSVRGFLAGVVRKKLGLDLASSAGEGGRVYRVADRQMADRPGADVDAMPASEPA